MINQFEACHCSIVKKSSRFNVVFLFNWILDLNASSVVR